MIQTKPKSRIPMVYGVRLPNLNIPMTDDNDNMNVVRANSAKEKDQWSAQLAHATKRLRLDLSIHMPLGCKGDGYLKFMTDQKHSRYLTACQQLRNACAEMALILFQTPNERNTEIQGEHELQRYQQASKAADAAQNIIWPLRQAIVERIPEGSK